MFPDNTANAFKIKLSQSVDFGYYGLCSLVQLNIPQIMGAKSMDILVLVNFVSESFVGPTRMPVVFRFMPVDTNVSYSGIGENLFVPVKGLSTDILEVSFVNGNTFAPVLFADGVTYCTFHFLEV